MTVSAITPSASFSYTGPGDYAYTFLCYDEDNLVVLFTDSDGVDTTLALGTDYTVALDSDFLGGTLTLINPADTSGSLKVDRVLPFTQEVDWVNNDPLDAGLLERSFDRTVMLLQQMNQTVLAGTSAFEWEGIWATGTSYSIRAMVEGPDGNWYYCTEAHTAGVFATDLASGVWTFLINRASLLDAVAAAELAEDGSQAAQIAAEYAATIAQGAAENIVAGWEDDPTSYDFPDLVAGSNGRTYRCLGTAVVGEDPTTDDGTNWYDLSGGGVPVGTIVAYSGGYCTGAANAGFTAVIANTAAAVNAEVNASGWYVCNGAALNLAGSPFFNGAGRYLHDLTDDRFLMGDLTAGVIGGDNANSHIHTTDIASFTSGATTLTVAQMPAHTHPSSATSEPLKSLSCGAGSKEPSNRGSATGSTGGGESHTHAVDPPSTNSSTPSVTENRPKFLSCFYIQKVF